MKLVADEGVDKPIVDYLRSQSHEVLYVLELSPGLSDEEVLAYALKEQAVLLTMDTDFGDLIYRLKTHTFGVLLLRIAGLPPKDKQKITSSILTTHGGELIGSFSVATKDSLRIRRL